MALLSHFPDFRLPTFVRPPERPLADQSMQTTLMVSAVEEWRRKRWTPASVLDTVAFIAARRDPDAHAGFDHEYLDRPRGNCTRRPHLPAHAGAGRRRIARGRDARSFAKPTSRR